MRYRTNLHVECKECDGNGYITWNVPVPHNVGIDIGYIDTDTVECAECAGRGWIPPHLVVDTED